MKEIRLEEEEVEKPLLLEKYREDKEVANKYFDDELSGKISKKDKEKLCEKIMSGYKKS